MKELSNALVLFPLLFRDLAVQIVHAKAILGVHALSLKSDSFQHL